MSVGSEVGEFSFAYTGATVIPEPGDGEIALKGRSYCGELCEWE
jgi:hypothetical protein